MAVAAQGGGERGGGAGDLGEAGLHERVHGLVEGFGVVLRHVSGVEDFLFQGVEPGVDDGAQGARGVARGGQAFGQTPVDRLQPVQRRLGLGDLDLGRGQAHALGPLGQPSGEERLAGAVVAADGVEGGAPSGDDGQVVVEGPLEAVEADGEQVEPELGHRATAQGIDHIAAAGRAHRSRLAPGGGLDGAHQLSTWNCSAASGTLSRSLVPLSLNSSTG